MLNRPKKWNTVYTKSTVVIFPPSLPFAPLFLTLRYLIPNHVLSPCYACFEHVMDIMEGYESKTCLGITQFVLENTNEAKGRLGEKIAAVLLY